jgi:hypothetical protein
VFAWYETDEFAPAPGRFISNAGVPTTVNLDFACCSDPEQLTGLFPLASGTFAASCFRNSIFAALSNNRAVVLLRNIVDGRHQLLARILRY